MADILFILEFLGGLMLLMTIGSLIGHFFGLDEYWKHHENNRLKYF